ncbi:MAG: hypothetical protein QM676_02150 [Novosphingobium sp.]
MDATLSMVAARPQDADCRSAGLERLTQITLDDLISSFGWQDRRVVAGLSRKLFRKAAHRFARQIAEFDAAVGRRGLVDAAHAALSNYVTGIRVLGREHVPDGPFLALSNHPGMTDALSLFAALDRPDLLAVALERPFLQALPQMSKRLCCVSDRRGAAMAAVRRVGSHLRGGGAALTFPAGHIEPDPAVHGRAAASLASWAPSAGAFLRLAPEAAILPVAVSGVTWPATLHRLLGQGAVETGPGKAGAALQLLAHLVLKVRPAGASVHIGRPIHARGLDPQSLHQAVLAEMARMMGDACQRASQRDHDAST